MAFSCVSSAQTCSSRRLMFTTTRPKFEVASIRLLTYIEYQRGPRCKL